MIVGESQYVNLGHSLLSNHNSLLSSFAKARTKDQSSEVSIQHKKYRKVHLFLLLGIYEQSQYRKHVEVNSSRDTHNVIP